MSFFALVFFATGLSYTIKRELVEKIIVLTICSACVFEALMGIGQIFGMIQSRHYLFPLTGTLNNPGPYGGLMAVMLSVVAAELAENQKGILLLLAVCAAILVLPATLSRAAWLALFVAALVYLLNEKRLFQWMAQHKVRTLLLVLAAMSATIGMIALKPASALGRLHIWHMDLLAMLEKPITGWGIGKRAFAFGEVQASFYGAKERSQAIVALACCPKESFNEYLSIGVSAGIPAFLLSVFVPIIAIKRLLKKKSPLAYGLIALSVFAFFSYPLDIREMNMLLAVFLGASAASERRPKMAVGVFLAGLLVSGGIFTNHLLTHKEQKKLRENANNSYRVSKVWLNEGTYDLAAEALAPLVQELSTDYRFLYDYGYALYKTGHWEESNLILSKGADISCDPMFHNIMGRNFEAMGKYEDAEKEYLHSLNMVPCRLYPYILLMEMNVSIGNRNKALHYGNAALKLPVNERNANMKELHLRAQACVDSLASR
ncbi:MAG: O-antigen ligase family protein [Bacteroidaceae bacterium]|nr:O-antigen ligase family protein [Bacteroidaceae bacterium]